MSKRFVEWAGSVLAALILFILVTLLNGPTWAAFGFAYIAFLVWRLGDNR